MFFLPGLLLLMRVRSRAYYRKTTRLRAGPGVADGNGAAAAPGGDSTGSDDTMDISGEEESKGCCFCVRDIVFLGLRP